MPELPEVETVVRGLQRLLPGRRVIKATADNPKSFPNSDEDVSNFLVGATVIEVRRRAKVILIELSNEYSLIIHLKMTGQLVFVGPQRSPTGEAIRFGAGHPNESLVGHLPDASTRVVLTMADTSQLYFNDQRKFGWVRLMPTVAIADLAFFQKLGPEPLIQTFTSKLLGERLARRKNTTIKAAILDQSVIAGIGNIYADESLWGAKIHPATLVRRVSSQKIVGLHAAMQSVLQLSIDKGGSTARTYRDAEGRKGSYLTFASVFHREGLPCPRCGHTIIKTRVAGRGTHLCPHCQRLVRKPL